MSDRIPSFSFLSFFFFCLFCQLQRIGQHLHTEYSTVFIFNIVYDISGFLKSIACVVCYHRMHMLGTSFAFVLITKYGCLNGPNTKLMKRLMAELVPKNAVTLKVCCVTCGVCVGVCVCVCV